MRSKEYFVKLICTCALMALVAIADAQSDSTLYQRLNDTAKISQKDINDYIRKIFKPKAVAKADSLKIKPGKLIFSIVPGIGYTLVTSLTAVATSNVSFYTGKINDTYLSSITTISEFSFFNHQITIPIASNIWTKKNKFNLLGDWRYYKYPTYTYGLGGHSSLSNADLIDYSYIRVYQEVLKKIQPDLYAGAGYNLDYHFNIHESGKGDFQQYNNNATHTTSPGFIAHVLYDGRKNVNTPKNGSYGSITYRSNFTFMGSDNNWQSLQLDLRKYIKLSPHSDNILAFWNYDWFTFGGRPPYFDLPSTAWDTYSNIGRGYIQGRLRGTNFLYLESEYRFGITRNGFLGGVVFLNAQSVSEIPTSRFETILPGFGAGVRIKVNKLSSVNFCADYGIGTESSRGFFFNLCEIF